MKKRVLAMMLAAAMVVGGITACGGSSDDSTGTNAEEEIIDGNDEAEKDEEISYELSDETGIINVKELLEGFEEYDKSTWDDGTRLELELEKETQLGTWGWIHVTVNHTKIYDTTVSGDVSTILSGTYVENPSQEDDVEILGMKGSKVTFTDNSNSTSGPITNIDYVLLSGDSEVGEMGYEVIIRIEAKDNYEGAKEALEEQLEQFDFDFDAYEFGEAE